MKRFTYYVKSWNEWRKANQNGKLYQILVLFRVMNSPSFEVLKLNFPSRKEKEE